MKKMCEMGLSWLDHVARRDEISVIKKMWKMKVTRKRSREINYSFEIFE